MTAQILDGKALANQIKQDIKAQIAKRAAQGKAQPGLAVILVGEDPASTIYVGHKQRACEEVGIASALIKLPVTTKTTELIQLIETLNSDDKTHGILVQLPLPNSINTDEVLDHIAPHKDVDGFHPYNLGRLAQRRPALRPCTSWGVIKLLETTKIDLTGKHAVIVSASNLVGRPMALELLLKRCTVTICHRFTEDLAKYVRDADIVISATGKTGIFNSDWIKPGAIVVDVGIIRSTDNKITGDIDFESAKQKASWITPVPGGVGQMTVAMLLQNTLRAAEQK